MDLPSERESQAKNGFESFWVKRSDVSVMGNIGMISRSATVDIVPARWIRHGCPERRRPTIETGLRGSKELMWVVCSKW